MQKSHFFKKKLKFSAILRYTFGAISYFGSKSPTKSRKLSSDITSRLLKKSRIIKMFFRCNGANLRHLDIQKNHDFVKKSRFSFKKVDYSKNSYMSMRFKLAPLPQESTSMMGNLHGSLHVILENNFHALVKLIKLKIEMAPKSYCKISENYYF